MQGFQVPSVALVSRVVNILHLLFLYQGVELVHQILVLALSLNQSELGLSQFELKFSNSLIGEFDFTVGLSRDCAG